MLANAMTCGAHKAPEPTMVSYACKRQQMWHTQTTWNKCVYKYLYGLRAPPVVVVASVADFCFGPGIYLTILR